MKFIFLAGGLTGFVTASAAGWAANRSPESVLLDAMLGAVAGALLFRWFWSVVLRGMRETFVARHRAAEHAAGAKTKP
jgi:hypothetical protein